LKRLDFPTFGRPTSATLNPSRNQFARLKSRSRFAQSLDDHLQVGLNFFQFGSLANRLRQIQARTPK
jgi:hypothetical protein